MKFKKSSRDEISKLVVAARHYGQQANNPTISSPIKLQLAYEASRIWCNIVVRAQGLKISTTRGHHEKVINSLEIILGDDVKSIVRILNRARKVRNDIMYDGELAQISQDDASELIDTLVQLEAIVISWLKSKHPDLLPVL